MTLEHVDSAIAFAVVMLGASLLITVMTQGISTLLNLRGRLLQRALGDLLETTFPQQVGKVEDLVKEILEHPLISDSSFGSGDPKDRERQYRVPATLTAAIVVAVSVGTATAVAQRSGPLGLAWGLGAGAAAAAVVFVSSDRWELASALRLQELFALLGHVSEHGTNQEAAKVIRAGLKATGALDERLQQFTKLSATCRASMQLVADELKAKAADPAAKHLIDVILVAVGTSEERKAQVAALESMVGQGLAATAKQLGALADAELALEQELAALPRKLQGAAEAKLKEVEVWFTAAMDRAASRFVVHSRMVTIVCSFSFAFVAHFDAIALFKRLSSDAELRAKLVASSDAMMKQADKVVQAGSKPPVTPVTSPAPVDSAAPAPSPPAPPVVPPPAAPAQPDATATKAKAKMDACLAKVGLTARVPSIYAAAMLCPTKLEGLGNDQKPGPFPTRQDAIDHIERHVTDVKAHDATLQAYNENLSQLLDGSEMTQLFDQAASINGDLSRSGIDLMPYPYPGLLPTVKELPGLIAAAVLLSLGAPFWFNMLKTLTNLRPLVASREEKDRQDKQRSKASTA